MITRENFFFLTQLVSDIHLKSHSINLIGQNSVSWLQKTTNWGRDEELKCHIVEHSVRIQNEFW